MKNKTSRNALLAMTALGALTLYILACTSFSPDDTKVLYPSFDSSGAVGVAVYDRETRRSEMLFVPMTYKQAESNSVAPYLLRSQWLPDGQNLLVAWTGGEGVSDELLNLAVMPFGRRGPVRQILLPEIEDAAQHLSVPLCVGGDYLLLAASRENLARINLQTGALTVHEMTNNPGQLTLYPVPDGKQVFFIQEQNEPERRYIFGKLDPRDFKRTTLLTITNQLSDGSFFAYDGQGGRVAFVERAGDRSQLVVLESGKPDYRRTLWTNQANYAFGNAILSPKGDRIWASYQRSVSGTTGATFGLMEIPIGDAPIRETALFSVSRDVDKEVLYFQIGVSHDGKTAAGASTYLACTAEGFKPEDCALFFVDLNDPNRRVTKVPITMPASPRSPMGD